MNQRAEPSQLSKSDSTLDFVTKDEQALRGKSQLNLRLVSKSERQECSFWLAVVEQGQEQVSCFSNSDKSILSNLDVVYQGEVQVQTPVLFADSLEGSNTIVYLAPLSMSLLRGSLEEGAPCQIDVDWKWALCEQLVAWQPKSLGLCLAPCFQPFVNQVMTDLIMGIASSLAVEVIYLEIEPLGLDKACELGLRVKSKLDQRSVSARVWHP